LRSSFSPLRGLPFTQFLNRLHTLAHNSVMKNRHFARLKGYLNCILGPIQLLDPYPLPGCPRAGRAGRDRRARRPPSPRRDAHGRAGSTRRVAG
jgi:hypothetical protein